MNTKTAFAAAGIVILFAVMLPGQNDSQPNAAPPDRQVAETENRLRTLMEEQNALPQGTLDRESVRRRIQEQDRLLAENAAEQAALNRRIEAISAYIDQVQSQPPVADADAALREFTEQLRRAETLLREGGYAEHSFDAQVLRAKITDASINLALRKTRIADQKAEEVRRLDQQKHEAMMQLAELSAREKALSEVQSPTLDKSMEYEILEVKIQAARDALRNALAEK